MEPYVRADANKRKKRETKKKKKKRRETLSRPGFITMQNASRVL